MRRSACLSAVHGRLPGGWAALCTLLALLGLGSGAARAQGAPADPLLEQGRSLYESGIAADGQALRWHMPGSSSPQTGALPCAGCHGRSGYGKAEGGVVFPAIAAPVLFEPGAQHVGGAGANPGILRPLSRSAYDDGLLVRALVSGLDPDGRSLRTPMPRYELEAGQGRALTAYLRSLGRSAVPGWTPRGLVLAVVLTPGATPARQQALWQVLQAWAARRPDAHQPWLLRRWALQGPPAGWPAQLAAFEAAEPAYALLSGAGGSDWAAVDDFCQARRLPCVLPSLESAPPSPQGPYGLYFHGGLDSDARAVAEAAAGAPLQHRWGDAAGQAAANSVRARLRTSSPGPAGASGAGALAPGDDALADSAGDAAAALAGAGPGSTLVLWLRAGPLRAVLEQTQALAAAGGGPARLWLSATLADPADVALPAAWQGRVSWFGVHDPQAARRSWLALRPWLQQAGLASDELRTRGDAYAAAALFSAALWQLQRQAQQGLGGPVAAERLVEVLEQQPWPENDAASPYYTTLQLGPGRHQAVARSRLWPARGSPAATPLP